jgi:hypothetical protein
MSLRRLSSSGYVTLRLPRRQRPPPEFSVRSQPKPRAQAWGRVRDGRPQQLQTECERLDAAPDAAVAITRLEADDLKLEVRTAACLRGRA